MNTKAKRVLPTRKLSPAARFFYVHAGYSHGAEGIAEGRTRCAERLADAEAVYLDSHLQADVTCEWQDDDAPDLSWMSAASRKKVKTVETACLIHRSGARVECLASLGNITDADANYRRVVRAELAVECLEKLRTLVAAAQ